MIERLEQCHGRFGVMIDERVGGGGEGGGGWALLVASLTALRLFAGRPGKRG